MNFGMKNDQGAGSIAQLLTVLWLHYHCATTSPCGVYQNGQMIGCKTLTDSKMPMDELDALVHEFNEKKMYYCDKVLNTKELLISVWNFKCYNLICLY